MHYIQQSYNFVTPDSITYPFNGKIYILQDRYIFSSVSNLSSLAKNSEQLISIGQTPDLLGGLQTDPVVLSPLIIDGYKVIAFVATRGNDNAKGDVERVKFISAKFENNSWFFGVKQGHVYSFSYANKSFPRLTNEKLAEQTISNLMLEGLFKNNPDDKSIFESSWYVFN